MIQRMTSRPVIGGRMPPGLSDGKGGKGGKEKKRVLRRGKKRSGATAFPNSFTSQLDSLSQKGKSGKKRRGEKGREDRRSLLFRPRYCVMSRSTQKQRKGNQKREKGRKKARRICASSGSACREGEKGRKEKRGKGKKEKKKPRSFPPIVVHNSLRGKGGGKKEGGKRGSL